MIDASLQLFGYAPNAGGAVQLNLLDINISPGISGLSDQWREGRLRVAWPAMPNLTSTGDSITVTLQDSADGVNFANCGAAGSATPAVFVTIPGVASTGVAAGYIDMPLPPATRGPVGVLLSASAGAGNNTAALFTVSWLNE